MKNLLIISGTPGVGKSSVAKILKKKGWKILNLKKIARKYQILTGYDEKDETMIINEKKISAVIKKELGNEDYVIASHLSHFVSPTLVKLCVVLRCNPLKLEKRLKKRCYSKLKVAENVMCELLDVCLVEAIDIGHKINLHEIDTTKKKPASVAKEILNILNNKVKKSHGLISWIKND